MTRGEINKLDELWANLVKTRAGWKCEHCGRRGWMEAAHVAGRRYRFTRWGAIINGRYDPCGHCFCHVCHQNYDDHGPLEGYIVEKTIGKDRKNIIQHAAFCRAGSQEYGGILGMLEGYKSVINRGR